MQTIVRVFITLTIFTLLLLSGGGMEGKALSGSITAPAATSFQPKGTLGESGLSSSLANDQPMEVSPLAAYAVQYYDGGIQYSTITNCVSIIQGFPYTERGMGVYTGFAADPMAAAPGPFQKYYVHVVMAALGNSCSGQRAYLDISLPASTALAISTLDPVYCYSNGAPLAPCPQTLPPSTLNPGAYQILSSDVANAQTWPMPQGAIVEFQIPVVSSTALTSSMMRANVWVLDGNSSPWLRPQVGVYVFSNTPTLLYPSPSTIDITATGAHSYAWIYTYGVTGRAYFDLGTDLSYGLFSVWGDLSSPQTAWTLDSTWPGFTFTPNTLYHWRARFVPTAGGSYFGPDQTFQTLPDGQATVGSGTPPGCTGAAFDSALATPGLKQIVFNCGTQPVTIGLTGSKMISSNLTIDGGNLVTLSGNNAFGLFDVAGGATLTLNNLTLTGGNAASCGGAVHIQAGATLNTNIVRMTGNHSNGNGGGVCIEATGGASFTSTQISANSANGDGGGLYTAGLADFMWSDVSGNSAGNNGGGVYTTAAGAAYFITSLVAGNQTPTGGTTHGTLAGGGIYNAGTTSLGTSTVANNTSSFGGGIFNAGGAVYSTSSTIARNTADAGGKPAFNDAQAGGLDSSISGSANLRNTLIAANFAAGISRNCGTSPQKTIVSLGNNLDSGAQCFTPLASDKVNIDPGLGLLANNGGITRTLALRAGSPAIDAADNVYCGFFDQRGFMGVSNMRAIDGNRDGVAVCDIGAYEYRPLTFVPLVKK